MNSKEKDLYFIKEFSNIKVSEICNDLKIDRSNIYRGIASAKTMALVREEIMNKYDKLLKEYYENNIDSEKK